MTKSSNTSANWARDLIKRERRKTSGYLRFRNGQWIDQDGNEVVIGTKFVANVPTLSVGFIRFKGKGEAPQKALTLAANNEPVTREELGDLNPNTWPLQNNGEPKDPWNATYELDAADAEMGRPTTITASTWTAREAVLDLVDDWDAKQTDHPHQLPIIALGATTRDIGRHRDVDVPLLTIVGWTEDTGALDDEPVEETSDNDIEDLDDEIPF